MTDKEAIQYVISKVNNADEKGVELTEFDINKVETLISIINRQQAEIDELKHEREVLIEDIHHSADQINEQLEEIEKLNVELVGMRDACNSYKMHYDNAKAEIEDLNHSIDTLGRVKEQLKENLSEAEAKYQKEITRLDALLVCKNKVIRNLEKSFENAYDGAIKEFAERLKLKADGYGFDGEHYEMVDVEDIDDTYEEMVGEYK